MLRTGFGILDQSDTAKNIAKIIYDEFALHQSVVIKGFELSENDIYTKGELVVQEMLKIDKKLNYKKFERKDRVNKEGYARKTPTRKNTIGRFVNEKAFQYKYETRDGKKVTSIWRVQ